jgi:hypothetical protein
VYSIGFVIATLLLSDFHGVSFGLRRCVQVSYNDLYATASP